MSKSRTGDNRLKQSRHLPKTGGHAPKGGYRIRDECPVCHDGILIPNVDGYGAIVDLRCDSKECGRKEVRAAEAGIMLQALLERQVLRLLKLKRRRAPCVAGCPKCESYDRQGGSLSVSGPFPLIVRYDFCRACAFVLTVVPPVVNMRLVTDSPLTARTRITDERT